MLGNQPRAGKRLTIVYVSEHAASSRWVDGEIRESLAMSKAVIAMHKGDSPPARLPAAIVEHRIPVVPWDQQAIMRVIQRATA